jgi:hypothetical protein
LALSGTDCDAVYFSEAMRFLKSDIKVRVGFKEQQDPILFCYCFDYSRGDISHDLELRGETDIPDRVKAEIQRGFCACDVKNPSGDCCLGDLTRSIQQITRDRQVQAISQSLAGGIPVKAIERGAPTAAMLAVLSALACCLPFGIVGALGLASISVWIAPLRPWLLGAAVVLLVLGFWQIYRRGKQCSARRSPVSVALFWLAVVIVLLATVFPQLIANWLAG